MNSHHADLGNFKDELENFVSRVQGDLLDVGSGSGTVSQYLAKLFPYSKITGCDRSAAQIQKARKISSNISNLEFIQSCYVDLPLLENQYGGVVCRYALDRYSELDRKRIIHEIFRCINPGGWICLIELDGLYRNLLTKPKSVTNQMKSAFTERAEPQQIGWVLPNLVLDAGFSNVFWSIHNKGAPPKNGNSKFIVLGQKPRFAVIK